MPRPAETQIKRDDCNEYSPFKAWDVEYLPVAKNHRNPAGQSFFERHKLVNYKKKLIKVYKNVNIIPKNTLEETDIALRPCTAGVISRRIENHEILRRDFVELNFVEQNLLLVAPILNLATVLSNGDITMETTSVVKVSMA